MRPVYSALPIFLAMLILIPACGGSDPPLVPPPVFAALTIQTIETMSSPPVYAYDSQVAVNPMTGEIYNCWVQKLGEAAEVMWRHGMPGSFSAAEVITQQDGERSWNPSISAGPDGAVHFAWQDMKDGYKETHAKTWRNGSWGPESLLSLNDDWSGWDPDIEVFSDGRPVVAWFDHRFDIQHEILMRTGDGNGSWGGDIRLTSDDYWQYVPDIEIGPDDLVHLSYVDAREQDRVASVIPGEPDHHQPGSNLEIYYRTWRPGELGQEVRLTNTPGRSDQSHLAVGLDGRAHIIWLDESQSGYFRLYYTSVSGNEKSQNIVVSSLGSRSDLASIVCLENRIFVAYPEYTGTDGPRYGKAVLYVREILHDGRLGTPLTLADSGTNLHPRMVADRTRKMLWVTWMVYVGDHPELVTGESYLRLCGINVKD